MRELLDTAGELLAIDCSVPWVMELLSEGAAGELRHDASRDATVEVRIESDRRPFAVDGWEPLARGAWLRNGEVVVENACTAGFDLHFRSIAGHAEFTYRWRPPPRDRAAARLLRSRFHLLARATLTQYPVLWWAGAKGRAPLHASACAVGSGIALVTAPSGIGRSTLVLAEVAHGARTTGDNLAVSDGEVVWGLVEPTRVAGGAGRRMPHGRREGELQQRAESLVPDRIVVLRRRASDHSSLVSCPSEIAARSLVTSTYMAGELRRYWVFAATLSAGVDRGPSHPPISEVADALAARLPCFWLDLGGRSTSGLSEVLDAVAA
jgi:hypothetical protein